MSPTSEEKRVLTTIAKSRSGEVLIAYLERRKQEYITGWLVNLDEQKTAHLRGKASELNELITLLQSLSDSKE